jgi:hypothetical protein
MSAINRNITPDPRPSWVNSHLPNTPQVQRLLRREDRETLENVTKAIIARAERTRIDITDQSLMLNRVWLELT